MDCNHFVQTGEMGDILFVGCSTHAWVTYIDKSSVSLDELIERAYKHEKEIDRHNQGHHNWTDFTPELFKNNLKKCRVCNLTVPKDWED